MLWDSVSLSQSLSEQIEGFKEVRTENGSRQGQKLALTGLFLKGRSEAVLRDPIALVWRERAVE